MRETLVVASLLLLASGAAADGPGLGNLSYAENEVFEPFGFVENQSGPNGTNVAIMVRGYMMVIFAHDSGGGPGEIGIFDVSDPRHPVEKKHIENDDTDEFREAHSLPVAVIGDREYVAIQTTRGIQLWDLTDPLDAHRVGKLDLPGVAGGDYDNVAWQATWQGRWLYVAGSNLGVFVIDASDPASPQLVTTVSNSKTGGFRVGPLFAQGDQLVVSNMDQDIAMAVVDISDPVEPSLLGQLRESHNLYATLACADRVYGAGRDGTITIHSITDPTNIQRINTIQVGGDVLYTARQDQFVYGGRQNDFVKVDISDELNPQVVDSGTLYRDHPDHGQVTPIGNLVYIGNDHETGSAFFAHQTAPDSTPPAVEMVYPADGTLGVPQTSRVTVVFSDYIDTRTLRAENLTVRPVNGEPLKGMYTFTFNTVSFSGESDFEANTTYEVLLPQGGIRDVMGNGLAEELLVRFSTGATLDEPEPPPPPDDDDMPEPPGDGDGDAPGDGDAAEPGDGDDDTGDEESSAGDGDGDSSSDESDDDSDESDDGDEPVGDVEGGCAVTRSSRPALESGLLVLLAGLVLAARRSRRTVRRVVPPLLLLTLGLFSSSAQALSVKARVNAPEAVSEAVEFAATGVGNGVITYTWDFGDGTKSPASESATVSHTYAAPGHYAVIVVAKDSTGVRSDSFLQTIHRALPARAPVSSSTIALDAERERVCNVNVDNDSISCIDANTFDVLFETAVGKHPRTLAIAPDGAIWVANEEADSLSIVGEDGKARGTVRLAYGARPFGIVVSPRGDRVYASLQGPGKVIEIEREGMAVVRELEAGPSATGISLSDDGRRMLVTRLISPRDQGEVVELDLNQGSVVRTFELAPHAGPDTEAQSRGVPNYLRAVAISPDGASAWVPSKQDNTMRGMVRDGQPLTFETACRAVISELDLVANEERLAHRMDLNNRSLGLSLTFSSLGDYAFVGLLGVNGVEVVDAYNRNVVSGLMEMARGPDGLVLDARGRLFVNAFLARSVVVLDVKSILDSTDFTIKPITEVQVVKNEKLPAQVLLGKQVFYDAADLRMAQDGYMSCATCHLDGFEDGRVWDFTDRGEGLRNTTSLLGRRGTGQGRLHWSANFDEIQDFEHDIRNAFGGDGFLPDEVFNTGTRNTTLGDVKAGLSPELDALAAFVTTLDRVHRSPYRDRRGFLTAQGFRGREVFVQAGCHECHGGLDFTDSAQGMLHDVGTLSESSGKRLGEPLIGLDTPTLRGLWETAPYLHDGSAETLMDVITAKNPMDLHGNTSDLSETERQDLVAYLLQIDNTALEDEQPAQPEPEPVADAGVPVADASDAGEQPPEPPPSEPDMEEASAARSSSCTLLAFARAGEATTVTVLFTLASLLRRRRKRAH